MSHPSLNLAAHDFDAYAAEKASSNAFTRPRIEVKQRALAWARGVVARLAALGITVDVHGSDEHPSLRNKKRVDCQWVFFWRDQAARDELERLQGRGRSIAAEIDDPSPFTRHAFLALRLDAAAVEVCFAVHPEAEVDVENLRARLAEARDDEASPLTAALRALPEQFSLGLSPEHRGVGPVERVAASAVTSEALQALLERAAAGQVPLWIGWSVARDTAVEHSAILDEQLEDAIVALAPIYRLVAWSRENDRIALDRRIESVEQERARAHVEAEAETERWRTEQAEARRTAAEQARSRAAAHDPSVTLGETPRPPARPVTLGETPRPPARPARKPSLDTLFGPPQASGPRPAPGRPRVASTPAPAPPASAERGGEARPRKSEPPPGRLRKQASESPPDRIPLPAPTGVSPALSAVLPAPSSPLVTGSPVDAPERAPTSEPERERAPSAPSIPVVEKGGKVRVLSGPFADKVGIVAELDGRGGARVLLGLLSTRLELSDLEPVVEGRERPSLQSSHRKPLAPAPRKTR